MKMQMFRKTRLIFWVILLFIILSMAALASIQAADSNNPPMKTFARDPGRETMVDFDRIELTVARGAAEEMTVALGSTDLTGIDTSGYRVLQVYEFGPSGKRFSDKALRLRFKWDPVEYPGGLPSSMGLYYVNRESKRLELATGGINQQTGDFEAEIAHFSSLAIVIKNDWGESLNPYRDYVHNGEEHVDVNSLSLTVNSTVYSLPLRGGSQINFTRNFHNQPKEGRFNITDLWAWDFPSYYNLEAPLGTGKLIYKNGLVARYQAGGGTVYEVHWTGDAQNSVEAVYLSDGTRLEPRGNYETVYDINGNSYCYYFTVINGVDRYGNSRNFYRITSLKDCLGREFIFTYINDPNSGQPILEKVEQKLLAGGSKPIFWIGPGGFYDSLGHATSYLIGSYQHTGAPNAPSTYNIMSVTYYNGSYTKYDYAYEYYSAISQVTHQRFYRRGDTEPFRKIDYYKPDEAWYPSVDNYWAYNAQYLPIVFVDDGTTLKKYYLNKNGNTHHEETYEKATQKLLKKVQYEYSNIAVLDSYGVSSLEETPRPWKVVTQFAQADGSLGPEIKNLYGYDNWANTYYTMDPLGTVTYTLYNNTDSMSCNLAAYGMQNPRFISNGLYFNKPATQAVIVTDPVHQTQKLRQTHYEYDPKGNLLTERVVLRVAPEVGEPLFNMVPGPDYLDTKYTYNTFGSLSTKTDPNNNVIRYGYGPEYNYAYVTAVYSGYKLLASYEYDPDTGLKTNATDPKGNVFSYTYDLSGRLLTESLDNSDPNVAITKTITYNDWANQLNIKYGTQEGRITYDLFFGKPTLIERKLNGAYVVVKKAGYNSDGELDWEEDNLGRRTTHSYDALGREIETTLPGGQVIRNQYTQGSSMRWVTTTDSSGNPRTQYFDWLDQVIKVIENLKVGTTYTTQYIYDSASQLIQTTNDRGVLSTNTYDNVGRLIRVDYPQDGANPMAPEAYQYDLAGNLWKKTTAQGTKVMEYEFNGGYRVKKVTEADGRVINYTYDDNDNLVTQSVTEKNQSTPGVKYTYSNYDARNRAHTFTATLDGRTFTFGYDYDTYGRVTGITYPNRAEKVTYTYDELDRLLSIPGFVSSCGYDGDNKLKSMSFGNGVNTKYSYDINGRLAVMGADRQVGTAVEAEEMTLSNYTIAPDESNGSLVQCPAGQGTASYQYTGASGSYALKVIYYDESDGASTFKIRLNGVTIDQWTADRNMGPGTEEATSRNRLSRVKEAVDLNPGDTITIEGTASGGENARVDRLKIIPQSQYLYNLDYEYDPNGNITRIGEDYYKYDGLNRLVWAGNTKAEPMIGASPNPCIIPSGQTTGSVTITCNPPTHQFEVRVSVDGGPETLFTGGFSAVANWIQAGKTYVFTLYDCSGVSKNTPDEVLEDNLGNVVAPTKGVKLDSVTVRARQGYMSANPNPCIIPPGQSTASVTIHCSPPVSQFQVWVSINGGAELLMSGSKTSFVHWIAANKTYTFSLYDYTGGVKGAKLDSITVNGFSPTGEEVGRKGTAWEYDCAGNMTRIEQYIGGQMHDFQDLEYDLANRLWKKCRVSYENDANGNRTSRTLDSWVMGYSYDGENRLTQVTKNGVDVLDNVYDGAGMRIKEVKGGQTTYFVYQGNNPLLEYTPGDGKYKYFIYAGNKRIAEETDGVVKYYQTDHLGSTRAITDAAGNKVAEYKYRPYGERDSSSGAFSTDYQFTGKPGVDQVGLSYFGARFYDPEVGRFLSQDPAKQGLNWYVYANNNPFRYVDPDGRAYTEAIALTSWEINFIPGYGTLAYICLVVSAAGIEYGPTVMQTLQGLYSSAEAAAKGSQSGSQGSSNNGGNKGPKPKPVNLPSWKKINIDIEHITSGHTQGGSRVSNIKTLFPENMTESQIETAVRQAYRVCEKVSTQGDNVLVRGTYNGLKIEMWVNTATNTIETAYPVR